MTDQTDADAMTKETVQTTEPRFVEIGHGFHVRSHVCKPEKLIRLFRAAAKVMPSDASELLNLYWQPLGQNSPLIELYRWNSIVSNDRRIAGIADTLQSGKWMRFASGAVDQIPDDFGRDLVLHELAHCHTHAEFAFGVIEVREKHRLEAAFGRPDEHQKLMEEFADARLKRWKVDPKGIRKWCNEWLARLGIATAPFEDES